MSRILGVVLAGAVVALLLGWVVVRYVSRPSAPVAPGAQATPAAQEPGRRIGACPALRVCRWRAMAELAARALGVRFVAVVARVGRDGGVGFAAR